MSRRITSYLVESGNIRIAKIMILFEKTKFLKFLKFGHRCSDILSEFGQCYSNHAIDY